MKAEAGTSLNRLLKELAGSIPTKVIEQFVFDRLRKEHGLKDRKLALEIANYFLSGGASPYTISLGQVDDHLDFLFSETDENEVLEKCRKLSEELPNFFKKTIEDVSRKSAKQFQNDWEEIGTLQRIERTAFESRVYLRWKQPIDLLYMQIHISREIGDAFAKRVKRSRSRKQQYKNECLGRLHVRAVRVFAEATRLLETGYPDAALARWRTMHEISVVINLLAKSDEDVARRYFEHQVVDELRNTQAELMSFGIVKPHADDQNRLDELIETKEVLIAKYGKKFGDDYGWAEPILNGRNCNFRELEAISNLEKWRSRYRQANGHIHATSRGLTQTFSTPYSSYFLSSAASNFGMTVPGQSLSRTMLQINFCVLDASSLIDKAFELQRLAAVDRSCFAAFASVHKKLLKDEGLM